MLYVMVLMAIELGLRPFEICQLKMAALRFSDCIVRGHIISLPVHILGKNRNELKLLTRNDNCPILCPVNALMWWLSAQGSIDANDFLFEISEAAFSSRYKSACIQLFKSSVEKPVDNWTPHGLRRTQMLKNLAAGASDLQCAEAAGLKCTVTLQHYVNDYRTMFTVRMMQFPEEKRLIGTFVDMSLPKAKLRTTAFDSDCMRRCIDMFESRLIHLECEIDKSSRSILTIAGFFRNGKQMMRTLNARVATCIDTIKSVSQTIRSELQGNYFQVSTEQGDLLQDSLAEALQSFSEIKKLQQHGFFHDVHDSGGVVSTHGRNNMDIFTQKKKAMDILSDPQILFAQKLATLFNLTVDFPQLREWVYSSYPKDNNSSFFRTKDSAAERERKKQSLRQFLATGFKNLIICYSEHFQSDKKSFHKAYKKKNRKRGEKDLFLTDFKGKSNCACSPTPPSSA